MIDPNLGRIGGGGLLVALSLSMGVEPTELCEFIIDATFPKDSAKSSNFNRAPCTNFSNRLNARNISATELVPTSTIMYGSQTGGNLHEVIVPTNHIPFHTQLLDNGKEVPPMGANNWSWIGIITLPTKSIQNLNTLCKLKIDNRLENLCF